MENSLVVLRKILKWLDEGKRAAIATVVSKTGSGMREIGAKMGISSLMEITGSVSGGCVESAVVHEALESMKSGEIKLVDYGISDKTAWNTGLICGGTIRVLIQPIKKNEAEWNCTKVKNETALIEKRETFSTVTVLEGNFRGNLVIRDKDQDHQITKKYTWWSDALLERVFEMREREESGIVSLENTSFYIDTILPQPRLVIIGAAHVSIPLVKIAKVAGYCTVVIDPRRAFLNRDRFPEVDEILVEWPQKAIQKICLSKNDFLLVLSHDDKIDFPALEEGLSKGVRYIGMLSSRKTRNNRCKKLAAAGFSRDNLVNIRAPVGLDIGAKTPEEIAIAILGEITAFRHGRKP